MSWELYYALGKDPSEALPLIRKLLTEGHAVKIQFLDRLCDTPLHKAARDQTPEMIELLLDHGAHINALNKPNWPPLQLAISFGNVENCKILLNLGADASIPGYKGASMLAIAVSNEHPAIVKLLLDRGVEINTRDIGGGSVLHRAVMIDHAETILVEGQELVRIIDSFSTKKLEIMRLLIDHGIDIEMETFDEGTALHSAALVGDIEAVHILIDAGANPNIVDYWNRKPLWIAARKGLAEIVELLLKQTTIINDQVFSGHTCLSTAARWGETESVRLLLDAGAEIWCQEPGPHSIASEKRAKWFGCDALYWSVNDIDEDGDDVVRTEVDNEIVRMILATGVKRHERCPESQYAGWLEVLDRAQPDEVEDFRRLIRRRLDMHVTPEINKLRLEMSQRADRLHDERKQKIEEETGIIYGPGAWETVFRWDGAPRRVSEENKEAGDSYD